MTWEVATLNRSAGQALKGDCKAFHEAIEKLQERAAKLDSITDPTMRRAEEKLIRIEAENIGASMAVLGKIADRNK